MSTLAFALHDKQPFTELDQTKFVTSNKLQAHAKLLTKIIVPED